VNSRVHGGFDMVARIRAFVTVAALATAITIGPTAGAAPLSAAQDAAAKLARQSLRSVAKVKLVVEVRHCGTCVLEVAQAQDIGAWHSSGKQVTDGRVVFHVPRSKTRGMYMQVFDPDQINTGVVTVAVLRYKGHHAGATVGRRAAARARKAFGCSAKIVQTVEHWRLRVDHFAARDPNTGVQGYAIRPYLSPAASTMGQAATTWKGTIGYNGEWYCNPTTRGPAVDRRS
jgi:hypothetical protein